MYAQCRSLKKKNKKMILINDRSSQFFTFNKFHLIMFHHCLWEKKIYFPSKFTLKFSRILLNFSSSSVNKVKINDEKLNFSSESKKSNNLNKFYSETLLLPKTNFPLRADAVKREILFRDRCTKDLYQWQVCILSKNLYYFSLNYFDIQISL